MSKFVLKQTNDGMYHLYFDTPSEDGFIKVSQASKAKFIKEYTHVILYDGVSSHKKSYGILNLFGIMRDEVFQVTLPENSSIRFLNNCFRVCIFERKGQWHTMQCNRGLWEERLLGEMHEIYLSFAFYKIQYGYEDGCWKYFLQQKGNLVELSHFIKDELVVLGCYLDVKEIREGRLICFKTDGDIDIFAPYSFAPLQGKEGEMFDALDGVFIWFEAEKKWIFHENCRLWGKNAVFHTSGGEYGEYVQLYLIEGKFIRLIAEGRWKWMNDASTMCIEGMKYTINYETGLVDFYNPKPTFGKKLKDFFKYKK